MCELCGKPGAWSLLFGGHAHLICPDCQLSVLGLDFAAITKTWGVEVNVDKERLANAGCSECGFLAKDSPERQDVVRNIAANHHLETGHQTWAQLTRTYRFGEPV